MGPAFGDELAPIVDTLRAGADAQYLAVRCSGLYDSLLLYGGEAQLGAEIARDLEGRTTSLMQMAALMRVERGVDPEEAGTQIMQETSRIADLYIARYHSNYAVRGLPFTPDPVWDADMETCREVVGAEHVQ